MQRPTTAKPFSFDFKLLRAACIALLSAQVPVLVATLPLGLHAPAAIAQTQSAEAIGKIAQAITVRIEGATQGSGVLVKRDGNRYTVLTAWHVISGQSLGEELDIYTPDGQKHQLEQGSIKRLGEVDMAVLTFTSSNLYEVAPVGDMKGVSMGNPIYVAGFPLASSAVPTRLLRFLKGDVIANATVSIPNGYQLLYSNPTLPGMSGGAVLSAQGQLVGIHGQGETDSTMSEQKGIAIKTGTNQAVPIAYYKQHSLDTPVFSSSTQAATADDYLAQANSVLSMGLLVKKKVSEPSLLRVLSLTESALRIMPDSADAYALRARALHGIGQHREAIVDATKALTLKPYSWNAFFARANAKSALGEKQGAIADYSQAIAIDPQNAYAYTNRGTAKSALGDKQGAIADFSEAISINPRYDTAYYNRGRQKQVLGDKRGAIYDYSQAIAINPQNADAYVNRGIAKYVLDDKQGAIADFNQALAINPQDANAYLNRGNAKADLGDKQGAITDYSQAIRINPQNANVFVNRAGIWLKLGNSTKMCADLGVASRLGNSVAQTALQRYFAQMCP